MSASENGWRAAGALMHPTALPSPYGIGDLGPAAQEMAVFLKKAGLHYWQVLPLTPTGPGLGNSPYSAYSAFAGHPLLISPDLLVRDGWLRESEARSAQTASTGRVDYEKALAVKQGLLDLAFERADDSLEHNGPFLDFAWQNGTWLNDYALFMAAKTHFHGAAWTAWPADLARREPGALHYWGTKLARAIRREKFAQYLFFSQLAELKAVLAIHGLGLIGDAAIYVNHDSADVWALPHLFQLGEGGQPLAMAGVPPDYFAENGQLWGNPLFRWEGHRAEGFNWWKHRLWYMLKLYDWIRLDHFRAFAAYWEVPAGAETAAEGAWRPGPGADLFEAAEAEGRLNIIAEDLGVITPDVTALRRRFGYPGMRVLQFAFGPEMGHSTHTPYRTEPDNVIYTATHDNNTTRGWFRQDTDELVRSQLSELCGFRVEESTAARALTRLAWLSPASLAVVPLTDLLNLDENARFNLPGVARGNWEWRLRDFAALTPELADQTAELGAIAGRDNFEHPNTLTY